MSCVNACSVKDRSEYLAQCCNRERQRADDLAYPMQAVIRVLDARDPNWRVRHHGDIDSLKVAFEVDFIVSQHSSLLCLIGDYINTQKAVREELMRPWWKRLLRIK